MDKEVSLSKPYSFGPYNKVNNDEQWIRISEGCPHNHPYCAEPKEIKLFPIPEIVRNKVKIMDMNLLCKPESLGIIKKLGDVRVNGKVVTYEFICGIDFRFLTQEIADALKKSRFGRIRFAWDFGLEDQFKIKDTIKKLLKAGYHTDEISMFFLCNWKTPYKVSCRKLDLAKVWNVKVVDCYFDNQLSPNFTSIYWTLQEMNQFRKFVRKSNQLVLFKIDPQIERELRP